MGEIAGLLEALDPSLVRREWRRVGAGPLDRIAPIRAIPSRDGTAALAYDVRIGRRRVLLAGRWYARGVSMPLPDPGHVVLERLRVVLVPPEADRELPGLAALLDSPVGLALPGTGGFTARRAVLLAHRPGKRGALRIEGERASRRCTVFAKAMRPRKIVDAARRFEQTRRLGLAPPRAAVVPRVLSVDEPRGLLFLEWIEAPALHESLGARDVASRIARVGRALRRLHEIAIDDLDAHDARAERDLVSFWSEVIAEAAPEHRSLARRVARRLERECSTSGSEPLRTAHRDFHDKQVLIGERRLAIVDLDPLSRAEPALDRGNFVAHLRLREAQRLLPRGSSEALASTFRRAYGLEAPTERDRLYESTTVFRLAGIYALRPAHRHLTRQLLELSAAAHEVRAIASTFGG